MFADSYDVKSCYRKTTGKPPQIILNVFMSLKADCTAQLSFNLGNMLFFGFQVGLEKKKT